MSQPLLPYALQPLLVSTIEDGSWHPGIGDPTILGWSVTLCYILAATLCLRRAWRSRSDTRSPKKLVIFWTACGLLMLLLCANKQFDLHQLLTEIGRHWAKQEGWFDNRRAVQAMFVKGLAVATAAALLATLWFVRGMGRHCYLALVGLVFTTGYIVFRAAGFHHIERILGIDTDGFAIRWFLELSGIFITGAAALAADWPSRADDVVRERAVED